MRIIAGKWRGAQLVGPAGRETRPMLDHVKEATFNILGARLRSPGRLPACCVLDLFAGTGALGLEALSRGARFCTLVEKHPRALRALRKNRALLQAMDESEIRTDNAWTMDLERGAAPQAYALIFVDPPYRDARDLGPQSRLGRLMARLWCSPAVHDQAMIVLHHPRRTPCPPHTFRRLETLDQRTYGDTTITFMTPGDVQQRLDPQCRAV